MTDDGKKISFGFAKSIKKSALKIIPKQEEKKVDYIECLDEKSIKSVGVEEKLDAPLVIPLLGSKTWHDRILNKTDADVFEPKSRSKDNGIESAVANGQIRDVNDKNIRFFDATKIKKEKPDETETVPKSLEEQAASEIINDLHGSKIKTEDPDLKVPITENGTLRGEAESTLEDYEQIPIDSFGLAMLRGMGWKPDKGIGKNAKLVTAALPELRPRGMGLGADKVTLQKHHGEAKTKEEEKLKLDKGSFVKIIAGKYTNNYGEIECFDDGDGRLIVKMALTGESKSLNECLVRPVTKTEYTKYSKVLNTGSYEEYKTKGSNKERDEKKSSALKNETTDEEDTKKRSNDNEGSLRTSKKSKKHSNYTSDESTDSDQKSRKRRNSSDSEKDHRYKKTKKSKKSQKRDSSSERSRKKSKKRDKDRHKIREQKKDSTEHKKHKKHKRSRSRSPTRK